MTLAKPMAYLSSFQPLTCGRVCTQSDNTNWLRAKTLALPEAAGATGRDKERAIALMTRMQETGAVEARASCLPEFNFDKTGVAAELFREDGETPWWRPTLARRMELFAANALAAAREAFPESAPPPEHLLQVSCTGYESPNAAQRLVAERNWGRQTRVLHIGHMGCYAAVPAITTAASIAQAFVQRVSVLHVELCTLHVRLEDLTPDQVVIRYLFADGAIRYDLLPAPPADAGSYLALLDSFEVLLPDSTDAMTWRLAEGGFRMTLARRVPASVAAALPSIVHGFLAKHGLYRSDIGRFAVHPGGSRVLEGVASSLELTHEQMSHSYAVLRSRGNMSSATLPHILSGMLTDAAVAPGELIVALAFGPGLTITGLLLRKHSS